MIIEIGIGIVALVAGWVLGRRTAPAKAEETQLLLENPDGPAPTSEDFEKLLEAAGFRVGRLKEVYGPKYVLKKGRFEGGRCLELGSLTLSEMLHGMGGWRLAYEIEKDCKYCNLRPLHVHNTLYRLGECRGESPGETCLVCWRCGWILHDTHGTDQKGLGGIVNGHTNIFPLLEEMTRRRIDFNVRARLMRVERERNELAALAAVLDNEKEHLIALDRESEELEKQVIPLSAASGQRGDSHD